MFTAPESLDNKPGNLSFLKIEPDTV